MPRGKSSSAPIQAVLDSIGKGFEDILTLLNPALGAAFKATTEFAGSLNAGLAPAISDLTSLALKPLMAAMGAFGVATSKTTQEILAFVTKSNPAAAFAFNRALDDLAGTMGQTLEPVLVSLTGFIRETADVFQGMKPTLAPIMTAISDIIKELTKLVNPLMELLTPAFRVISFLLTDLVVPALKLFISVLQLLADTLNTVTLGIFENSKKSSVGAAVRPAAYGKIDDIGKRTTLAALNAQGGVNYQKDMVDEQKKTNNYLSTIAGKQNTATTITGGPVGLAYGLGQLAANKILSAFD